MTQKKLSLKFVLNLKVSSTSFTISTTDELHVFRNFECSNEFDGFLKSYFYDVKDKVNRTWSETNRKG